MCAATPKGGPPIRASSATATSSSTGCSERARPLGFDAVATGHHARRAITADGRFRLCRGADPAKDQSYVLAMLGQGQLARLLVPGGGDDQGRGAGTRRRRLGLRTAAKPDSQDVCFIRSDEGRQGFLGRPAAAPPRPAGRPPRPVRTSGAVDGRGAGHRGPATGDGPRDRRPPPVRDRGGRRRLGGWWSGRPRRRMLRRVELHTVTWVDGDPTAGGAPGARAVRHRPVQRPRPARCRAGRGAIGGTATGGLDVRRHPSAAWRRARRWLSTTRPSRAGDRIGDRPECATEGTDDPDRATRSRGRGTGKPAARTEPGPDGDRLDPVARAEELRDLIAYHNERYHGSTTRRSPTPSTTPWSASCGPSRPTTPIWSCPTRRPPRSGRPRRPCSPRWRTGCR